MRHNRRTRAERVAAGGEKENQADCLEVSAEMLTFAANIECRPLCELVRDEESTGILYIDFCPGPDVRMLWTWRGDA